MHTLIGCDSAGLSPLSTNNMAEVIRRCPSFCLHHTDNLRLIAIRRTVASNTASVLKNTSLLTSSRSETPSTELQQWQTSGAFLISTAKAVMMTTENITTTTLGERKGKVACFPQHPQRLTCQLICCSPLAHTLFHSGQLIRGAPEVREISGLLWRVPRLFSF